ncbi:hypothetical protein GXP67_28095 [Rhodocytophaga rosea]|uniref:Tetratricopeptide repeat protein n=1 Tax=Rhodocytophaga rosea TaxID=2704465 RepID=A0A6C0GQ84_9BACT|nr:hypothetical protein [Rhodocytophaga rosea]QHT70235.1 hypothetical protein GXP67_28095 [Rhodocytophaga rosea]
MYSLQNRPILFALKLMLIRAGVFITGLLVLLGLQTGAQAQALLSESSPKYKVTRQVFNRLTYVFANSRPEPQLQIIARKAGKPKTIAQYQPGNKPLISLDEEVYDLCARLGKDSLNALAVLLSHELAHHYEKHDWYYTFGIGKTENQTSGDEIERFESEADFYGCFYGELAGFATGQVFPQILDLVYENFQLANQLKGYPSKEERKLTYQKKQTDAARMIAVFKAGQFLYLMQDYQSATLCFDYLVNRFPSREIFNNLSASILQQALAIYNSQQQPGFVYPVEMDARSRLSSTHRSFSDVNSAKPLSQLLLDARKYAQKAKEIDPDYVPAYINLACVYSLQGNQAAAIGVINELDISQLTGNAHTIRAIAYFKDQQTGKAQQDFESAQEKKAYMASYNMALFEKINESLVENLTGWIRNWFSQETSTTTALTKPATSREKIAGEEASSPLPGQVQQVKVNEKPYLLLQWSPSSDLIKLGIQASSNRYLVRFAQENYAGKTARSLQAGSSAASLVQQYGEPAYTFPGTSGEYWVYPQHKIAFEINPDRRISSWLIYARAL